jgi:hypothetical protein
MRIIFLLKVQESDLFYQLIHLIPQNTKLPERILYYWKNKLIDNPDLNSSKKKEFDGKKNFTKKFEEQILNKINESYLEDAKHLSLN